MDLLTFTAWRTD